MNNQTENKQKNKRDTFFTNYSIRCGKVRVIDESSPAKIMKKEDAIALAESKGLDLVQISFDTANHVAVCKILDYGKFKYEQSKREKNAKKLARANAIEIKTIQFSIATDDGDRQRLLAQAKEFLAEGDNVKLSIRFRNKREGQKIDYAKSVMRGILAEFEGLAVLDNVPGISGRELSCVIRPIKDSKK